MMPFTRTKTSEAFTESTTSLVKDTSTPSPPSHLALAFLIIFCPLIAVPLLLCAFISVRQWRVSFQPEEYAALPVQLPNTTAHFYTLISNNKVLLASSWTTNIAQFATVPFMFLFSFLVVAAYGEPSASDNPHVRTLLAGDPYTLWEWFKGFLRNRNRARERVVRLTALGSMISCILTVLLLIGDKTLMAMIDTPIQKLYSEVLTGNEMMDSTGFTLLEGICDITTIVSDPYDLPGDPPCSLNSTLSPWNIFDPPTTYRLLATGLTNTSYNYNEIDFAALAQLSLVGKYDEREVVTYFDKITNSLHALVLNTSSVEEFSYGALNDKFGLSHTDYANFGQDYVTNTTSIATKCVSVTQACGMRDHMENSTSMPYHCSDLFSGTLNNMPGNGIEKVSGWNTSFYNMDNGIPRAISISSQLNPFTYNVTALVNSLDLNSLTAFGDTQGTDGQLVDGGNDHIAFALSCESTVYNVRYSMIAGNISQFTATPASGQEAAIIKAPLQVGLGSYALFQQASLAVLLTNISVADAMGLAFSQVGLAASAGVYESKPSLFARYRADVQVTQIPKAPYIFLIAMCFLYAALVLVFAVGAFVARRSEGVAEHQALLLVERFP